MIKFYGHLPQQAIYAVKWAVGEEIVAIAGRSVLNGENVYFSDIKDDVSVPAIRVWKESIKFMKDAGPGYCITKTSGKFLEKLGWIKMNDGVYKWPG